MTVGKLIEELKKMPAGYTVGVHDPEGGVGLGTVYFQIRLGEQRVQILEDVISMHGQNHARICTIIFDRL